MLSRKLELERHGSSSYTSVLRLAAIGMAVGSLVLASHLATKAWYDGRILPGVVVAGHDLGGMSLARARQVIRDEVGSYHLRLQVANQNYDLTPEQIGVQFDVEGTVESAYGSGRDAWLPPAHHDPVSLSYSLDRSVLNSFATSVSDRVGVPPVDAGVVVHGAQVQTVADKPGWSIDRLGLERLIQADVSSPGGADLHLQPRSQMADIQVAMLGPTVEEAKQLMATPIILSYADKTFTPTPSDIGAWLAFQKQGADTTAKLVPSVDTAKLKNYIQTVANSIDVAPVNQMVTIENGVSKVTTQGVDGVALDRDTVTAAIADSVTNQRPLTFTLTTHAVPFKTISNSVVTLDLGSYIEVNLSKQHLWVWQDHNVIYESPITSGATGAHLGTVTGLFSIYYKTTNTHLVGYQYGYNYDVPVKYWMPFYSGYGLHDASWRNGNFGETSGPLGYYYDGSHGCVNLPDATAEFIYNWSVVGTPVWVHN